MEEEKLVATQTGFDFAAALRIAENVLQGYKRDHPRWWALMEGSPRLNDIAVRMAAAFLQSEVARNAEAASARAIAADKFKNLHPHQRALIERILARSGEKKQPAPMPTLDPSKFGPWESIHETPGFPHSLFEAAQAIKKARDAFIAQPIPPGMRSPQLLSGCELPWDLLNALCEAVEEIKKAPFSQMPIAWVKHVVSHNGPGGPDERDVDLWYGDEPPNETDGWQPLFGLPQSMPKSIDLHWRANIRLAQENHALKAAAAANVGDTHLLKAFQKGDAVFIEFDREISASERSSVAETFEKLHRMTGVVVVMLHPGARVASARRTPGAPPSATPACSDDVAGNPVAWFSSATAGGLTDEEKSNYVPASDVAHFGTPLYAKAPRETCVYRRVDKLLILTTCGRELSDPDNRGDFCPYCGSFIEHEET
jgi:hypothetical protein